MQPPFPCPTATWHNATYPAISPSRPELSARGKTIIIIGAGSGIGRETSIAYAAAGAARLVLLGRKKAALDETAKLLPDSVSKQVFTLDVADEDAFRNIVGAVATWDVLILAAAHVPDPSPMSLADVGDLWQSFETNVKGLLLAIKLLLPVRNATQATVLALTTGAAALPATMLPGLSTYVASKLAQTKLIEFLAAEQPDVFAATVHPGMVETDIFTKSGAKASALPMDQVELPAHFLVWMSSPEASFLRGRSVWANWDVEELKAQATQIETGAQMTVGLNGWPYSSM